MGSLPSLPSDRAKQQEQQHHRLVQSPNFKKPNKKTSTSLLKTVPVETDDNKLVQYKQEGGAGVVLEEEEIVLKGTVEQQQQQLQPDKLIVEPQDCNNDPMLAAANKLSQQYEKERAALMHTSTTGEPCILTTCRDNRNSSSSTTVVERFMKVFPKAKISEFASNKELLLHTFVRSTTEAEKRKERDRQQRLHYTLKRAFKGIYRAKIENPKLIVNWSSGAGLWDMEVAEIFPDCKIIAIDYKPNTLGDISSRLPNIEFRYSILDETHTGMETIDSNTVDYIMMRDCWMINIPSYKWSNVLNQAFRVLKPNGWIELSESSLHFKPQGKETAQLDRWFRVFFNDMEIDIDMCNKLGDVLKLTGFTSIDQASCSVPVGEWPADNDSRETGYLFKDMIEKRFRGLAKWLSILNDVEEDEIQRVITVCLEEETQANCSYVDWISYTARKPNIDSIDKSACPSNHVDLSTLKNKSSKSPQI